jgi:hypothetical protein
VVESHTLNYGKSPEVKGRDSKGAFFARDEQDGLKLFVSQNGLFSQYPLFQLVDFLAEYCGIKNIQHVQLLYTCLSKSTREDVLSSFNKLGLHVDIPNQGAWSVFSAFTPLNYDKRPNQSKIQTY